MKILTVVYSIGLGGTERAAVNYAIGYKNYGCESKVLVLGLGYDRLEDLNRAGIDTILVLNSDKSYNSIINDLLLWKPDIIHIHNFQQDLFDIIKIFKLNGSKIVETNVFSRPTYTKQYIEVDLSMQLSMWGLIKFKKWIKNWKYNINSTIVPYIVKSENFLTHRSDLRKIFREKYNIPENVFLVGRIGQPLLNKWDFRIIPIIKKILKLDQQIYFVLVGVPEEIQQKIIKDKESFISRITFIKILQGDEELSSFYQSIDCFAHISKIGESFGYVISEAMLFKIPVVSMLTPLKDNAQYEMIGNMERGICTTSNSQFVDSILLLKNNLNIYKNLKLNLDGWVESKFSESQIVPNLINQYRDLLKNRTEFHAINSELLSDQFNLWGYKKYYLYATFKFIHNYFIYSTYMRIRRILKFG